MLRMLEFTDCGKRPCFESTKGGVSKTQIERWYLRMRPVSSCVCFFAAVIQDESNMPAISFSQLLALIENNTGHARKIRPVSHTISVAKKINLL
jgi:hypothetical protein